MNAVGWHLGRMAPFDLETTSADPEEARIVEAYLGQVGGNEPPTDRAPLIINPGVPIPAEATAIHGYNDAYVQQHGIPAEDGVRKVVAAIVEAWRAGIPLVGHNIRYDLTAVDRELVRYGEPPLIEWAGGSYGPVIDTRVLSKHLDKWRPRVSEEQGAHALKTCAQVFGVTWVDSDAHGARYDALISARIAWRMGTIAALPREQRPFVQAGKRDERHLFDDIACDLPTLFQAQRRWAREQAASYQNYLRDKKKSGDKHNPDAVIDGSWPVQARAPHQEGTTTPETQEAIAS